MKKLHSVTIILPCFNEHIVFKKSVSRILQTISLLRLPCELLFVDDGSIDGTRKQIVNICKKEKQCRYVFHTANRGRGAAVATGIRKARGAIVGYMDIDCEVSPVYIADCIGLIDANQADIVVGRRMYRTSLTSLPREVLSVGYRWLVHMVLGTRGIDTESGYKFFHKQKFLPVLDAIGDTHWFWDTESIVRSLRHGLRVREVPVLFLRRKDKHSSVRIVRDTCLYFFALFRFVREA